MVFCIIIAILTTLYWIDSLIIATTNAKVNPYRKNPEEENINKVSTIVRLSSLLLSSIFWGVLIYNWINF